MNLAQRVILLSFPKYLLKPVHRDDRFRARSKQSRHKMWRHCFWLVAMVAVVSSGELANSEVFSNARCARALHWTPSF